MGDIATYMMAEAIEKAGEPESETLMKVLCGAQCKTLLGDVSIRDFDGQATFSYNAGLTYTHPNYPCKRLKDATRADGNEVLHLREGVEKIRAEYLQESN